MNLEKLKDNLVTYKAYCDQILTWENESFKGKWQIPESLSDKVDETGKLKPFYGDTTVVFLDKILQKDFYTIQKTLEDKLPIFAESLDYKQFHITIHDLNNSPIENDLINNMDKSREKTLKSLSEYNDRYSSGNIIKLKSTSIFPSNHTALIIGFIPATESDYQKFLELYNILEKVIPLNYWPCPHATLNYFKPQEVSVSELIKFKEINLEINFDLTETVYQRFTDMNNYFSC